jgi:hypothetical protein
MEWSLFCIYEEFAIEVFDFIINCECIMWFYSCVDTSGRWGHGGMFDALTKLSSSINEAYERASEHGDLHLGDLHLIRLEGEHKHKLIL